MTAVMPSPAVGAMPRSPVRLSEELAPETAQMELRDISEAMAAAEREGGYPAAVHAFKTYLGELPLSLMWRAHLELAECAKKSAAIPYVKFHLLQAIQAQPRAVQVWRDASRTFDELGELVECRTMLEWGIECCPSIDTLLLKLERVLERLGDHAALRALIGSIRHEPVNRMYKVLVDASHFEVRRGNEMAASAVFRNLISQLPHNGSIYCDACQAEYIMGNYRAALGIAERGVQICTKHGPLWFALLRYAELVLGPTAVRNFAALAQQSACEELHWKFHVEVAMAFSRAGELQISRQSTINAALLCPKHLRWKIWTLAARAELWDGSVEASRKLAVRARAEATARMQAAVCVERARAEEYLHNVDAARKALAEAHFCESQDWKISIDEIFMEVRQGRIDAAMRLAASALEMHPGSGRLWAAVISLEHCRENGVDQAVSTCTKAVPIVPKSGEVWCEAARIFMNPLGRYFHLGRARKSLEFATHFTPQYGDSFLEFLRLRLLLDIQGRMRTDPIGGQFLSSGAVGDRVRQIAVARYVSQKVCKRVVEELRSDSFSYCDDVDENAAGAPVAEQGCEDSDACALHVDLPRLEILCGYADPNYGFLWYWCRESELSAPRDVLRRMFQELASDLISGGALWLYAWAVARGVFGLVADEHGASNGAFPVTFFEPVPEVSSAKLHGAESGKGGASGLERDFPIGPDTPLQDHSELSASDFAVGLVRLSRTLMFGTSALTQKERRRLIFGSDIH